MPLAAAVNRPPQANGKVNSRNGACKVDLKLKIQNAQLRIGQPKQIFSQAEGYASASAQEEVIFGYVKV